MKAGLTTLALWKGNIEFVSRVPEVHFNATEEAFPQIRSEQYCCFLCLESRGRFLCCTLLPMKSVEWVQYCLTLANHTIKW